MSSHDAAPLHCRPEAFEALVRELEGIDTTRGLVRAAVAVAMHGRPDADPDRVETQIAALADSIRQRCASGQPRALLAHAHVALFEEAGFRGNADDYYHPDNSDLGRVLATQRGLPISLTLLYKAILEHLGLRVRGVNAPGHFLAEVLDTDAYRGDNQPNPGLIVDVFAAGRVLSRDEAFARIEEVAGGAVARDEKLLRHATHPDWLIRMIQNLVTAYDRRGRTDDLSAMLELRTLVESVK
ncbi:MAG: transglutaminase-like domain-containing protein [Planctomycetota bacterium]